MTTGAPAIAMRHSDHGSAAPPGERSAAVRSLGVREAMRLAHHPVVLLGLAGAYLLALNPINPAYPMSAFDGLTVAPGLVLGPCSFFAANLAASRHRRAHTEPALAVTPTGRRLRSAGLLLAAVVPAVLSGVLLIAVTVSYHVIGVVPIRWPSPWEFAVVPVTVMGGALLGVLAASWCPRPGGAALVMVVVFTGELAISIKPETGAAVALAPFAPLYVTSPDGAFLGWFPASMPWHLVYLLSLNSMAAIGALLATPGPKRALLGLGAAAVCVAAFIGSRQLR
jgi:hypothetical protein